MRPPNDCLLAESSAQQPHDVTLGSHSEHQGTALRGVLLPRTPRSPALQLSPPTCDVYAPTPGEGLEALWEITERQGGRSCGGLTGAGRSENYNT